MFVINGEPVGACSLEQLFEQRKVTEQRVFHRILANTDDVGLAELGKVGGNLVPQSEVRVIPACTVGNDLFRLLDCGRLEAHHVVEAIKHVLVEGFLVAGGGDDDALRHVFLDEPQERVELRSR